MQTWVKDTLVSKGLKYREHLHSPIYTAKVLAHREHVSGTHVAKVVIVIADGKPYLLVLPANRYVLLHEVRELLGSAYVRMASEGEMQFHFPDCDVGAIPPLPHWKNVDVLMDAAMKVKGNILFQAGTHDDAIEMDFDDWFNLVNPRVESFTSPEKMLGERDASYRNEEEESWQTP